MTSFTPTHTHSPSSHFSRSLFHIPAPSFKLILSLLDFSPPFLSTAPTSDSSITSIWLPVGSSHSEMYEHEEKWMANSIKSIIPEAAPCYQQHCKGVLMHCLHAQPPPSLTPHSHRNQSCCGLRGRETSFTESSETREGLFQRGDTPTAVSHLPSLQGSCCHRSEKSSVRCQHHVQTRSESYQSAFS